MYDEHFELVLSKQLKPAQGKGRKYQVVKTLPTPVEYQRMKQQAFTAPLSEILSDVQGWLQERLDDLRFKLDSMSERALDGERGERISEQVDALGEVVYALNPDQVPSAAAKRKRRRRT